MSVMETLGITDALALGGFCLGVYNCILEIVRRRPRAVVRVRKRKGQDGVDKGFAATIVNVGEVAFTVSEVYLVKRDGKRIPPFSPGGRDSIPKLVSPGEDCEVIIYGIDGEKHPVIGDVVRVVFAISSGKKFRSVKLPEGLEGDALRPALPVRVQLFKR